jgi:hypothetical protein
MRSKLTKWLLCCIMLFQFAACSTRPDDVMSRKEMRSFLTDLHLLEGVFSSNPPAHDRERAYYYNALFEKHGITKAEFDSSLVYYTKNPKVFERIYARVNNNLEALKADVAGGKYFPVLPDSIRLKPEFTNIWSLDTTFTYPADSAKNKLHFSIANRKLLTKDIYDFSFRMRAVPRDSLQMGYTAFRIHYADGQVDSLWHEVVCDSLLRRYKFRFRAVRNYKIDSLSGVFYAGLLATDTFKIKIDSISLHRKYVPVYQDSLLLQLDTVPKPTLNPDSLLLEVDTLIKPVMKKI